MRALTLTAAAALGVSLALAPVFARAADKDWDACVNGDGNDAYIGCEAFLKRGDTESAHDRAIAYSYLGRLKYIQGDFRGGIEEYTEAIKLDPTMAEAYAGRGWVHHAGSEYALGVADYEQALALRPDYTYLQGKLDAAKAALAGEPTPAATPAQQEAAVAPQPAAAAVAVVPPATPAVTLGTRVALVIGNSAYVSVPRLPNPTGDAEAIAQVLRADGFKSVTVVEDASRHGECSASVPGRGRPRGLGPRLLCGPRNRDRRHQLPRADRRPAQIRPQRSRRSHLAQSRARRDFGREKAEARYARRLPG
jgi:tetratricopeptide (TPR) repeat protein